MYTTGTAFLRARWHFNPSIPILSNTRCFVLFHCTYSVVNGAKNGVKAGPGISGEVGILVEINQITEAVQPKSVNVGIWPCSGYVCRREAKESLAIECHVIG